MRVSSTESASSRLICGVIALCGLLVPGIAGSVWGQTARAVVLRDVVIDGRLDEWPDDLERYPIRNNFQVYGPTDIDGEDLGTSDDLSPQFRVAYGPDENLLYVAVEARDDEVVVGNDPMRTDACEVYVYGLDSIEQRLTDTQDVMIDLNEKYDNLDKGKQSQER